MHFISFSFIEVFIRNSTHKIVPDFNNCPTDLASMLLVCMLKSMEVRSVGLLFIKSTKICSTFIDFIEEVLKITKIV